MAEEITKDTETTDEVVKTVPYERFKLVNEERNTYKTSLAEKDNQITALNEKKKLENSRKLINKKLRELTKEIK